MASKQRRTHRRSDLARRIAEEPFKSALANAWRAIDVHGLLAHYIANDAWRAGSSRSAGVDLNTDDRNVVEFRLARSVGITLATVADIRNAGARGRRVAAAARRRRSRAVAGRGHRVAELHRRDGIVPGHTSRRARPPSRRVRPRWFEYYRNDDLNGARTLWEQQPEPAPRSDGDGDAGRHHGRTPASSRRSTFIDRLRAYRPGEADVMLATLRLRQAQHRRGGGGDRIGAGALPHRPVVDDAVHGTAVEHRAESSADRDPRSPAACSTRSSSRSRCSPSEETRLVATSGNDAAASIFPGCAVRPSARSNRTCRGRKAFCASAAIAIRRPAIRCWRPNRDLNEFLGNSSQPLVGRN